MIQDLDSGAVLYDLNSQEMFVPGSTTKIFTVAAALDAYGPDYRFKTPVYITGPVDSTGTLHGDIILVASGDMTMGGRTTSDDKIAYTNIDHCEASIMDDAQLTKDPLAGLDNLTSQIVSAGIKRVDGNVIIDDRLFESVMIGSNLITPIIINDNLIDVVITPTQMGETANITWRPQTNIYNVACNVKTVSAEDESDIEISSDGKGNITVEGQIPLNHQPLVKTYQVEDPASFARSLMIESLKQQEIDINASINTKNPNQNLPEPEQYENMERVAILTSPPLSENAKLILKVSHNLHANTLVPLIAVKNGKKTFEEGLELEKSFIESAGINPTSLSLGDGAGGATSDLISPVAAAKLLRYMNTTDYYQTYQDALPILGVDGTLATTVKPDSTAQGKVQAKTGTLIDFDYMNNVLILRAKGLAGYMTSSQGKNLVFVIYVNNVRADSMDDVNGVGEDLGRICELIYETY